MKLRAGNPRVRAPRRSAHRDPRPAARVEPATFAWVEPLADVDPVFVEREVVVESLVDRPVFVDRTVEVEKIVDRPIYVDRTVEVEKIVEKPVFVERPVEVEKIVEVEKVVERPAERIVVEKIVEVEKPVVVEKEVSADKDVAAAAAGTAAAAKKSGKDKAPKAIIIGRGPSLATKLGRIMPVPKPLPVLAGAASLLAVIAAFTLMSPSGDNANAERAAVREQTPTAATPGASIKTVSSKGVQGTSRDPFHAKAYVAPKPATASAAAKKPAAKTAATAPAATLGSLYSANLTTYSSYTPWTKVNKTAGGWIVFGGKPTVKVLGVGKDSLELFVVTNVEVVKDQSKHISYNDPIRQIKVAGNGVVRFTDYRDIQGDDVTYTIRFNGTKPVKVAKTTKSATTKK